MSTTPGTGTGPTITAIAPWFGSKRTLAPDIIAELGPHTNCFEPFCGSCSVLLAKPPARQETVNDLHTDLTNLVRVLSIEFHARRLYQRLEGVIVSDVVLADAHARLMESWEPDAGPDQDRAFSYFVQCWMMRNGCAGTNIGAPRSVGTQLAVRFTASGGSPSVRFRNATESIPWWHERLKNVVVLNRDAFKVIPKIEDAPGTVIYVDSPYLAETRSGFAAAGAQSRYLHEFKHGTGGALFEADDHSRLAEALCSFKHARIVVSYYDHDRLHNLYPGWRFEGKTRNKNLSASNGRGTKSVDAPEVLIVNGPAFEETA
jgi:DNA adenine methylase